MFGNLVFWLSLVFLAIGSRVLIVDTTTLHGFLAMGLCLLPLAVFIKMSEDD